MVALGFGSGLCLFLTRVAAVESVLGREFLQPVRAAWRKATSSNHILLLPCYVRQLVYCIGTTGAMVNASYLAFLHSISWRQWC